MGRGGRLILNLKIIYLYVLSSHETVHPSELLCTSVAWCGVCPWYVSYHIYHVIRSTILLCHTFSTVISMIPRRTAWLILFEHYISSERLLLLLLCDWKTRRTYRKGATCRHVCEAGGVLIHSNPLSSLLQLLLRCLARGQQTHQSGNPELSRDSMVQ